MTIILSFPTNGLLKYLEIQGRQDSIRFCRTFEVRQVNPQKGMQYNWQGKPFQAHMRRVLSVETWKGVLSLNRMQGHVSSGKQASMSARLRFVIPMKKYHCSPDGLGEDNGGLELKCPKMKTHISYLLSNTFPKKDYNGQVQGSMLVTDLPHWWFMSYYPGLRPFIVKVERDEEYIEKLRVALNKFCLDLAETIKKLRR